MIDGLRRSVAGTTGPSGRYGRLIRCLDILYAVVLIVLLSPVILILAVALAVREGRPIFYRSERMRAPDQGFMLWKFRTMRIGSDDGAASGGHKAAQITPLGGWLRRRRLDELPQLWNILKGDMSFVGPRPPLRRYVEICPELYARVLEDRPGVTGLASLAYHRHEDLLLRRCQTVQETEAVYVRRCIPAKARLDLLYARRRTPCSDMRLMFATVFKRITMHNRAPRRGDF